MQDFSVSNWLWIKDWDQRKKESPVVVCFKKSFKTASKLKISANSRYKLYVNNTFVQEGPQKGTAQAAFVDIADITEYVKANEENEVLVKVLYYPEASNKRNDSLYHSPYPCLYMEDLSETGELSGERKDWQAAVASEIILCKEPFDPAPIHGAEIVEGTKNYTWEEVRHYNFFESKKAIAPFNFEERTIPPMEHTPAKFNSIVCVRECDEETEEKLKEQYTNLIQGTGVVEIPANTTQIVELSAGEEMCGYPTLKIADGKGAKVEILYAECYAVPQPDIVTPMGTRPGPPLKGDRADYIGGQLIGFSDIYTVGGFGTKEEPECYEPYLFRTFTYIQLKITTAETPLSLISYDYLTTGYPLEVKNHPISSREDYNKIWDISLRTLKRCMHETYVDCPFYEQLQYTMDSRAEMLFTYEVSGDDRLPRQAMESFRKTQRYDGTLQASAPAAGTNVIPGFNIFYIMMIHDHMKRFQDKKLVRHHFNCMNGVLDYFNSCLTEKGLVGAVGGVLFQHRYWSFIDWCAQWDATIGVPEAKIHGDGSLTMESLLYLYGLNRAAEIADFIGYEDMAKDYRSRAESLEKAILENCVDQDGMIMDGPGVALYSTHCQVWAVLNDLVSKEQGRKNIEKTYKVEGIPQCSVSMSFYLIEALHKLDILKEHDDVWNPWRKMLDNHMTTCVENDTDGRSDCHAWGSIMLYALPNYYGDIIVNK